MSLSAILVYMITISEQEKQIKDLEKRVKKLETALKKLTEVKAPRLGNPDELFNEAVELFSTYDKVSSSLLQRRLSIGYARAARIIDQLVEQGKIKKTTKPGLFDVIAKK